MRSSPGPSRGPQRTPNLPLTSITPPYPLPPSPPLSHYPSPSTSRPLRRRSSDKRRNRAVAVFFGTIYGLLFCGKAILRSARPLWSSPSQHAPSALDEQYGGSGPIRGHEQTSDVVDASWKVWWPLSYLNAKVWSLFSPGNLFGNTITSS